MDGLPSTGLMGILPQLFILGPLAVAFGVVIARFIDRFNGVSFKKDVLPELHKDSKAIGFYYGCRLIMLGLIVHAVFNVVRIV